MRAHKGRPTACSHRAPASVSHLRQKKNSSLPPVGFSFGGGASPSRSRAAAATAAAAERPPRRPRRRRCSSASVRPAQARWRNRAPPPRPPSARRPPARPRSSSRRAHRLRLRDGRLGARGLQRPLQLLGALRAHALRRGCWRRAPPPPARPPPRRARPTAAPSGLGADRLVGAGLVVGGRYPRPADDGDDARLHGAGAAGAAAVEPRLHRQQSWPPELVGAGARVARPARRGCCASRSSGSRGGRGLRGSRPSTPCVQCWLAWAPAAGHVLHALYHGTCRCTIGSIHTELPTTL